MRTKLKKGTIKNEHVWASLLFTTSLMLKVIIVETMFFVALYLDDPSKYSILGVIINLLAILVILLLRPRFARMLTIELEDLDIEESNPNKDDRYDN